MNIEMHFLRALYAAHLSEKGPRTMGLFSRLGPGGFVLEESDPELSADQICEALAIRAADQDDWAGMSSWTPEEAVFLIHGFEPFAMPFGFVASVRNESPFACSIERVMRHFSRAVADQAIPWRTAPLDWLRLAARKKIPVPIALKRAVEREAAEPVDLASVVADQKRAIKALQDQLGRIENGESCQRLSSATQWMKTDADLIFAMARRLDLYCEDGRLRRGVPKKIQKLLADSGRRVCADTTIKIHLNAAQEGELPDEPL